MSTNGDTRLLIEDVTHRYGKVAALSDVSLAIEDGELVTLLGPSGCGKTTLLRIIAGFIKPSSGRILLQGRDVTRLPPHKRPVNMVFQRATLFPHLDVYGNVAFGLQIAGLAKEETASRVSEVLPLVRLEGYEHRRAHELSGGQMQRVALARALVNRPRVLLLDEPLSALDQTIRLEMEAELRRVHRETGATFVYVTHDQREALALSDRIVVFDHGHVEQVGPPGEIYRSPASRFAAQFVGDANVIPVNVIATSEGTATVQLPGRELAVRCAEPTAPGPAWLVVRPEVVRLAPAGGEGIQGRIRDAAYRGAGFSYRIEVPGLDDLVKAETAAEGSVPYDLGTEVTLSWDASSCGLLARDA
jgi:ABC-type Fe3+/spermidine/putrescine transport system ATPase subunit